MRRLVDWFNTTRAKWKGTCVPCGRIYYHRGTEPTQHQCRAKGCSGTIVWQIEEV